MERPLRSCFNPKDSGVIFTLALALIMGFSSLQSLFYFLPQSQFLSLVLTQAAIILCCLIYCRGARIDFVRAIRVSGRVKARHFAASFGAGISMMFALIIPVLAFIELLKSMGFESLEMDFKIVTEWDLVLGTILIAMLPAVCEEILFRGIVLQGLRRFGDGFAVGMSALLFTLLHTNPEQTLYPLLSGAVMGFAFIKTGDLKYPMLIHFLNNFLNVALDYIYNNLERWGYAAAEGGGILLGLTFGELAAVGVCAVIFALCMLYFARQRTVTYHEPQPLIFKSVLPSASFQPDIFFESVSPLQYLVGRGFKYDLRKDISVLPGGGDLRLEPPPGFADVSDNPAYNPYYAKKSKFFLWALPGIIICVALWLFVFFNPLMIW